MWVKRERIWRKRLRKENAEFNAQNDIKALPFPYSQHSTPKAAEKKKSGWGQSRTKTWILGKLCENENEKIKALYSRESCLDYEIHQNAHRKPLFSKK